MIEAKKTLRLKQKESYRDSFKLYFAAAKTPTSDSLKQRGVFGDSPEPVAPLAAWAVVVCSSCRGHLQHRRRRRELSAVPLAGRAVASCSSCRGFLQHRRRRFAALSGAAAQTVASCSSGRGSLQLPIAPSSTSSRTIYPCRRRKHGSPQSEAPVVAGSGQGRRKVWQ